MIVFPHPFVALDQYPGYFWNIEEEQLYSIKQVGILRPLKKHKPSYFNEGHAGYEISVEGKRRYIWEEDLLLLRPSHQVIPVGERIIRKNASTTNQCLPTRQRPNSVYNRRPSRTSVTV